MAALSIEERLSRLEARQEELRKLVEGRRPSSVAAAKAGWKAIVGSFENDPLYDEAMELGREWRERDRDSADRGPE